MPIIISGLVESIMASSCFPFFLIDRKLMFRTRSCLGFGFEWLGRLGDEAMVGLGTLVGDGIDDKFVLSSEVLEFVVSSEVENRVACEVLLFVPFFELDWSKGTLYIEELMFLALQLGQNQASSLSASSR